MATPSYTGRDDWDAVASAYEERTEALTSQYVNGLLDVVEVDRGDHVVDVACGPGAATLAAARRGASVTAVDFSPEMLSILRRRLADGQIEHVEPVEGDAQDLQLEASSFDCAVSVFGVIFCPDVRLALTEMRRVVRSGGRAGLTAWTRPSENSWTSLLPEDSADQLGFAVPPLSYYRWSSKKELADALRDAGFIDVVVECHRGDGPVVRDADRIRTIVASSPVNRTNLGVSDAQRNQIADLIGRTVEKRLADTGEVVLPAEAWIATASVP